MVANRAVKWVLAAALVLAAFIFACVRISDAIDDSVMEMRNNSRIERIEPRQPDSQPVEPEPQQKAYPHDDLIRT